MEVAHLYTQQALVRKDHKQSRIIEGDMSGIGKGAGGFFNSCLVSKHFSGISAYLRQWVEILVN